MVLGGNFGPGKEYFRAATLQKCRSEHFLRFSLPKVSWNSAWNFGETFRATFSRVWVTEGKVHQNFTSKTVWKTENFTQISLCWGAALKIFSPTPPHQIPRRHPAGSQPLPPLLGDPPPWWFSTKKPTPPSLSPRTPPSPPPSRNKNKKYPKRPPRPHSLRICPFPMVRPLPETMVSIPLWAQKTLETKGFVGLERPFLDLVSQPKGQGYGAGLLPDLRVYHLETLCSYKLGLLWVHFSPGRTVFL